MPAVVAPCVPVVITLHTEGFRHGGIHEPYIYIHNMVNNCSDMIMFSHFSRINFWTKKVAGFIRALSKFF